MNKVLTNFSPSPIHLLVKLLAEILKNTAFDYDAIAFHINVLPVPGGLNSNNPLGGALNPVKISGLNIGQIIASYIDCFAFSKPDISSHCTYKLSLQIYCSICSTRLLSKSLYLFF